MPILGLGHVGIYVRDLERMAAFYRDVMGMTVTKQDHTLGLVFFSADPTAVDHEIALVRGRPADDDSHQIHQVSLHVASLQDVRTLHRRLVAEGCQIDVVLNHGSAIGCYFFDPEGNRTEVFWLTGRDCWAPAVDPIDLDQSDESILEAANRVADRHSGVPVGGLVATSSG